MQLSLYQTVKEFFIPKYKKGIIRDDYNLVLDFLILTTLFALFYCIFCFIVNIPEGVYVFSITDFLFLGALIALKIGSKPVYIKHVYIAITCFVGVFGATYLTGGLFSPVIPWFALIPISALLLFGNFQNTFIWLTISLCIIITFFAFEISGYKCPNVMNEDQKKFVFGVSLFGLVLITFLFCYIFQSFINNNLNQLKAAQNQLIQSEKLASLGELTAGIAHEIQNPLNFVNNFSELSVELANDLNEEIKKPAIDKEYIAELLADLTQNQEKISHHGKRASSIVKGMLEHSRSSTGIKELTDINKLADEYLRLSYHGLRAKDKKFNADFKANLAESLPKIEIIPQDIGRVLLNLMNNAFYAVNQRRLAKNPEIGYQPLVTISTQQVGNFIIIKIRDNGTGMPDSVKEKIFQPFFTTKPTGEGTGLGLSLSYDIVTKGHGGSLEVESAIEAFTEFVIKIPVTLHRS
jgi:two-component system, NtrC family, sensor kinase